MTEQLQYQSLTSALKNIESPQMTSPAEIDTNNEPNAENASSISAQFAQLASLGLLNNGESPHSQMPVRATPGSNNSNSSSGNHNSVVVGATSTNTASMFLAPLAGRDLILNIGSMDQAKEFLASSILQESSREVLNSESSALGTTSLQDQRLHLSTSNPTPNQQTGSSTTLPVHGSSSTSIDSPISPPIYDHTSRHYTSLAPATKSQMKRITPENLKRHIPEITHERIVGYMCTPNLFHSTAVIPLWRSSPSLFDSIANHTRNWTRNIYLGDVGVFDEDGGFDTYFNIFESTESNKSRGHKLVPQNFIPYHKKLSEMSIRKERYSEPSDTLRVAGFTRDVETSERNESVTLRFPINSTRHICSALHMRDGFLRLKIQSREEGELMEYFRSQQGGWYESLAKDLNGRYLAIITTSYRTKAWASVTATSSKKVGRVRLVNREIGQQRIYSWAPEDNEVFARSGPSGEHIEKIGTYLRTLAEKSDVERRELEECHVVAVEAYYLHEKTSRLRMSRRTNHTNKSHQTITQRAVASVRKFFR